MIIQLHHNDQIVLLYVKLVNLRPIVTLVSDNWYLYATTCDDNRTTNQIMVAQMDNMMEMLLNVLLVKHHVLNMMD